MIEPRSERQRSIHHYVTEYGAGHYESAVSIFTDDVRWIVVGAFESNGRDQYVANMTNDKVEGHPMIDVIAYIEGDDEVVVEGTATQALAGGPVDHRAIPRRVRVPGRQGVREAQLLRPAADLGDQSGTRARVTLTRRKPSPSDSTRRGADHGRH